MFRVDKGHVCLSFSLFRRGCSLMASVVKVWERLWFQKGCIDSSINLEDMTEDYRPLFSYRSWYQGIYLIFLIYSDGTLMKTRKRYSSRSSSYSLSRVYSCYCDISVISFPTFFGWCLFWLDWLSDFLLRILRINSACVIHVSRMKLSCLLLHRTSFICVVVVCVTVYRERSHGVSDHQVTVIPRQSWWSWETLYFLLHPFSSSSSSFHCLLLECC
jgi:hypothetical protein